LDRLMAKLPESMRMRNREDWATQVGVARRMLEQFAKRSDLKLEEQGMQEHYRAMIAADNYLERIDKQFDDLDAALRIELKDRFESSSVDIEGMAFEVIGGDPLLIAADSLRVRLYRERNKVNAGIELDLDDEKMMRDVAASANLRAPAGVQMAVLNYLTEAFL